jgi:hypothetical protein
MSNSTRIWIPVVAAALSMFAASTQAAERTFGAKLTGASELPDPTQSTAEAELALVLSADGKSMSYKLTVTNIQNPIEADIHLGPDTMNGPLVVKLFPVHGDKPKKGPFSGVLAEGSFTSADLIGPLKTAPLSDLIDQMVEGNTYTNIHTDNGVGPANTGPGDMARGEIRGQIK